MYNYVSRNTLSYFMEALMARTGILYSHVVHAAAKVVADGKNPTVDSVREALGGTGSKSTIAPLLKRWKAEHQETVIEAETGVPAPLLLAVKAVYEQLQEDAGRQVTQAREAQRIALQAAAERLEQSETDNRNLSQTKLALAADLAQTKDELAQLRAKHHAQALALATLESDNGGLRERLADRAAEVAALNQQLTQTRQQFEHYQEAAAEQRTRDRQAADQRAARLEQDMAGARQHLQRQQTDLARQEAQIAQLAGEQQQWQAAAEAARTQLAGLQAERDQQSYQFQQASLDNAALADTLDASQAALDDVRIALAVQQKQADFFKEQLSYAEEREAARQSALLALIGEKATLQAQLGGVSENGI
ncbi:DNA-binding protein [Janthinobacterium sp. hw3]|uniref:DNA-binding protein n=2 Tax=Janthinobacterium fluminis TaxID=2987524 RepID=A0ABT5JWV3_9BURK|nr:DNA-binding protein [Janthinobacterium fluminis]